MTCRATCYIVSPRSRRVTAWPIVTCNPCSYTHACWRTRIANERQQHRHHQCQRYENSLGRWGRRCCCCYHHYTDLTQAAGRCDICSSNGRCDRSRSEKAHAEIKTSKVHVGQRADADSTLPTQGPRVRETGDRRRRIQSRAAVSAGRVHDEAGYRSHSRTPLCLVARPHRNSTCAITYV